MYFRAAQKLIFTIRPRFRAVIRLAACADVKNAARTPASIIAVHLWLGCPQNGEAPRELTAFDHPLVTTPGGIDNDVETVATFTNLSEQILDFAINEVIALNALD